MMPDNGDPRIAQMHEETLVADPLEDLGVEWADFVPMPETVLVRLEEEVSMTKGGVYLPSTAREQSTVGTVVKVSDGEVDLLPGDIVLVEKTKAEFGARPFKNDPNLVIVNHYPGRESDILGKFVKEENP